MGQIYTIFSQACYYCNTPPEPIMARVGHCQGFSYKGCCRPPLQSKILRRNRWHIPEAKTEESDPPSDSPEPEYILDHENPCDLCDNCTKPTKMVGNWVVCQECFES